MIVYEKASDWKPTGEELPTETAVQILVDAAKEPLPGVYSMAEARKHVEVSIAKNPDAHYRFEIVGASAKALAKAGIKAQPQAAKAKAAPKAKAKAKPAAKAKAAPKGKKESGKARRARLKAAGICTACGVNKARKGLCECKECADYYAEWARKNAGKK